MTCKTLLAAVALAAAPLAAQHPTMGSGQMAGDPMMQRMGGAMMKMMLYTPQHLLAGKEALGLSPDQIAHLTALRDRAQTVHEAAEVEAQAHMKELEQAANAPKPDTSALKVHFQAAHTAMGKAHWATVAAAAQARTVLTESQLAKVQAWADSMQTWAQQHRRMMKTQPH